MTPWWLAVIVPASIHVGVTTGFLFGVLWAEARTTSESEIHDD